MTDDHVIPAGIAEEAKRLKAAVIVNDYYLSRRQRVHFAWVAETDEHHVEKELTELLQWILDRGPSLAILVPGVRRRPQPYYEIMIRLRHR